MDNGDRAIEYQCKQGHRHCDPLKGVDLEKQYKLINMGLCKLSLHIQELITKRWELGQ